MQDAARLDHDQVLFTQLMTAEAFGAWSEAREGRWELVHGVPIRMMGESRAHRSVKKRLGFLLEQALPPGAPCRPEGDGALIRIPGEESALSADDVIDCDPDPQPGVWLRNPVAIFEVAVSSRLRDLTVKRASWLRVPSVQHVVVILPESREIVHFQRGVKAPNILSDETLILEPPGVSLPCVPLWARL